MAISDTDRNTALNTAPPQNPVRLVFIHHSCGQNWLADENGGLGRALMENNYAVSDTNYGWGANKIGDWTDIGHWWKWFRSPESPVYLQDLYRERAPHSRYTRMTEGPDTENEIVMFKSCYPNSELFGDAGDVIPAIDANPLRGNTCDFDQGSHSVNNAKGIYLDLLEYFKTRPDKLFVAITAPAVLDPAHAQNARRFNTWLVRDWLKSYPLKNVAVFDFYNILTSNGGDFSKNDLGQAGGSHHRLWEGRVQHAVGEKAGENPDTLKYPSDGTNNHPGIPGNQKATGEFLPLLNLYYNTWKSSTRR